MSNLFGRLISTLMILASITCLSALGEVGSSQFLTTLPQTSFRIYFGSAIAYGNMQNLPLEGKKRLYQIGYGAMLSKRLSSLSEARINFFYRNGTPSASFNVKYLMKHEENISIGIVPGVVYGKGNTNLRENFNQPYVYISNNAIAKGVDLPVVVSYDTQRNLRLNLCANAGITWVKKWGKYKPNFNSTLVDYDFATEAVSHVAVHAGFNALFQDLDLELSPEIGIIWVDTIQDGLKTYITFGVSMGTVKRARR